MSAEACTFKMGWDTNGINACKTSPKAFPPVMLFADAPNETSQRKRSSLYAELKEGRPAPGCTVTPLMQLQFRQDVAYRERDNMGNVITRLPNVRESHLFCRPFDCSFLRWQIQGNTMQMWMRASSHCYHPILGVVF